MSLTDNNTILETNRTTDSSTWLLQFSLWPLRVVCPLLIIICPITNWACIRVFQARVYTRSSSKWYFISIAIFDTIYVFVTAPLIFLVSMEIFILNWHQLLCKSVIFFNYLSCQISAGLLACLSIDRLFATSWVSLYRRHCTTHLSKTVCIAVVLMFAIVNSHYLIGYSIDSNGYCSNRHYKWYEANYARLNVVYLLSYSIIPFTIITICNLFIVLSVCQNKTNMKKYDLKNRRSSTRCNAELSPTKHGSLPDSDKPRKTIRFQSYPNELDSIEDHKMEIVSGMRKTEVITNPLDTISMYFRRFFSVD